MTYRAPVDDIAFALRNAAGLGPALADGLYGDLSDDVIQAVLEQAGKFATDVLAPLNTIGDRYGKYRVIAWACAASAFTALACAAAPTFGLLTLSRFAAGATAGAIFTSCM